MHYNSQPAETTDNVDTEEDELSTQLDRLGKYLMYKEQVRD